MKYYLDTEFIEGFHKPLFGKRRHFIDLISIGIVDEAGVGFHAISSEYNYNDADDWVKENVIMPLYISTVHGDMRNRCDVQTFHKIFGKKNSEIAADILNFFGCWRDVHFYRASEGIEVYGYYADYDWVLFCSLFGRMIDLPKGFPMHCIDLKQTLDEVAVRRYRLMHIAEPKTIKNAVTWIKQTDKYPKQTDEHNALADAEWNKQLHEFLLKL